MEIWNEFINNKTYSNCTIGEQLLKSCSQLYWIKVRNEMRENGWNVLYRIVCIIIKCLSKHDRSMPFWYDAALNISTVTVSTSMHLEEWRVRWGQLAVQGMCLSSSVPLLPRPYKIVSDQGLASSWPLLFCDYSKGWQDPRKWDVLAPYAGGRPADHRHVGRATTTEQV